MKTMRSKIRNLKKGVSNLFRWLPIIWKDRDWDYEYLYEIIHKKLEHMDKYYRSNSTHIEEAIIVADEIKEAKDLLANKINAVHTDKIHYDKSDFFKLENKMMSVDKENKNYQNWIQEMRKAEKQESDDMRKAFQIIGEKSERWWD